MVNEESMIHSAMGNELSTVASAMVNEDSVAPSVGGSSGDSMAPSVEGNGESSSERRELWRYSSMDSFSLCLVAFVSEVVGPLSISSSLSPFPSGSEVSFSVLATFPK